MHKNMAGFNRWQLIVLTAILQAGKKPKEVHTYFVLVFNSDFFKQSLFSSYLIQLCIFILQIVDVILRIKCLPAYIHHQLIRILICTVLMNILLQPAADLFKGLAAQCFLHIYILFHLVIELCGKCTPQRIRREISQQCTTPVHIL